MNDTKEEHAQEALRRCKEQFLLFNQEMREAAILILSPKGDVLSWNPGTERIVGYKADEIIAKHFSCFFPPEAIALGEPQRELRATFEQGSTENDGWRVRKDGSLFWAHIATTALFDKQGVLRAFAKVMRDMTEKRDAERSLSEKNIELQNALEAKDRFLADMSRELRTPLLQLINNVLNLAKVNAGKIRLDPERISLRKAIMEVCDMVKPIAEKKSIRVDISVAPELGEITLDQREFKKVLYNLLFNAVKFTDDDGRVEILAVTHDKRCFKLTVSDTGIGIKAEDLPRLFRPFEQLESGTTRRYEGMGLGLLLTQKIVELQGGTIYVESKVGQGSCFTGCIAVGHGLTAFLEDLLRSYSGPTRLR